MLELDDIAELVLGAFFAGTLQTSTFKPTSFYARPGGERLTRLFVPRHMRAAGLVAKGWQREFRKYLNVRAAKMIPTLLYRAVQRALDTCECERYPYPFDMDQNEAATVFVQSFYMDTRELFSMRFCRQRALVPGERAHELVVTLGKPAPDGSYTTGEPRAFGVAAACWVSIMDMSFSTDEMDTLDYFLEWRYNTARDIEAWLKDSLVAFGAMPLFLM